MRCLGGKGLDLTTCEDLTTGSPRVETTYLNMVHARLFYKASRTHSMHWLMKSIQSPVIAVAGVVGTQGKHPFKTKLKMADFLLATGIHWKEGTQHTLPIKLRFFPCQGTLSELAWKRAALPRDLLRRRCEELTSKIPSSCLPLIR